MKALRRIYTALVFIFLYAPIGLLILLSFNTSKNTFKISGFTLNGYKQLFGGAGHLLSLFGNSLILALVASVIAAVLGTMAALGISRMRKPMRNLIMYITNIPMTNPDIVTGVSMALLFVFIGMIFKIENILGFWTLLVAHVTFGLPYVILSVMPKIGQMDPNLVNAATDLGCTPAKAFFKITLREIMPGILTGAVMTFALSLDDFVISYFVYGPSFTTLPVEIYNYTKKPIPTSVYALFTLIFAVLLVLMIIMNVMVAKGYRNPAGSDKKEPEK